MKLIITEELISNKKDEISKDDGLNFYANLSVDRLQSRLVNNKSGYSTIVKRIDESPFIRIYPEESLVIPIGVSIQVPEGYHLSLTPSNKLYKDLCLDIVYPELLLIEGYTSIVVRNSSGITKHVNDNDLLAHGLIFKKYNLEIDNG